MKSFYLWCFIILNGKNRHKLSTKTNNNNNSRRENCTTKKHKIAGSQFSYRSKCIAIRFSVYACYKTVCSNSKYVHIEQWPCVLIYSFKSPHTLNFVNWINFNANSHSKHKTSGTLMEIFLLNVSNIESHILNDAFSTAIYGHSKRETERM